MIATAFLVMLSGAIGGIGVIAAALPIPARRSWWRRIAG
jgi:hypothetical protein